MARHFSVRHRRDIARSDVAIDLFLLQLNFERPRQAEYGTNQVGEIEAGEFA